MIDKFIGGLRHLRTFKLVFSITNKMKRVATTVAATITTLMVLLILVSTCQRMLVDRAKNISKAPMSITSTIETEVKQRTTNYSQIYFLKTHKTASSVIENILMR